MQDKHLYEYAVIRFVPKVEREEFINVGVILFSKQANYIRLLYKIDERKMNLFPSEIDFDLFKKTLESFDKISKGEKEAGVIAQMDVAERFRWITAVRSSCVQTSRPHSGFSTDLNKTAQQLFDELVL